MSTLIHTDTSTRTAWTSGLKQLGWHDLRVVMEDASLLPIAEQFVEHMIAYQRTENKVIRPNETVRWGYWTTQFRPSPDGLLEVWEYCSNAGENEWVHGVDRTLSLWQRQSELCESLKIKFDPPHSSEWAMVSPGVLEGMIPVDGVRFFCDSPDSGWVFTCDDYDGDPLSLRQVHLYHVTDARPELSLVVSVTPGHYFRLDHDVTKAGIWYDPEIASKKV